MEFNTPISLIYKESFPHDSVLLSSTENSLIVCCKVNNLEEWSEWLQTFEKNTKTKWILRSSNPSSIYTLSKDYVCQHSSWKKSQKSLRRCDCNASLSIRIKKNTRNSRYKDSMIKNGFLGKVTLKSVHSHTISTAHSLSFLRPSKNTQAMFSEYFQNGLTVAEAIKYHEDCLEMNIEENLQCVLADASINPKSRTVTWWYDEWRKTNLGERTDSGAIEILKKRMIVYEEQGCTIRMQENPFGICILTPMMKRAHNLPLADQIVFVDTTASCDSQNHAITLMLTPCAAGAVPLCVLICQGQTELDYTNVFTLLKNTLGEKLFGNGSDPKTFMTDDSDAEFNALKKVWPRSSCKLCLFHVPQAIWRWLWDSKHAILKEDRQILMKEFQPIIHAESPEIAVSLFMICQNSTTASKYPQWLNYIQNYWNTKERWCKAWRGAEMYGHHTNNFTEAAVRLYKDEVLGRCKAYNSIALVDFTVTALEKYYVRRLRKFANSRDSSARLLMEKQLKRSSYIADRNKIIKSSEHVYEVPSEIDPSVLYSVDLTLGVCSCLAGRFGRFCKHQAAVFKFYDTLFPNMPKISSKDRADIAYLCLGSNVQDKQFYEPLIPNKHLKENNNDKINLECTVSTAPQNLNCTNPTESANEEREMEDGKNCDLSALFDAFSKCNKKFGSSVKGIEKLTAKINSFTSKGQYESFLYQGKYIRAKEGAAIHTQPTSRSRRKSGATRGCKRLAAGRPALTESIKKKRKRKLGENINKNQPNAKTH